MPGSASECWPIETWSAKFTWLGLLTELHHNFKRANGYSDLEIAQKRSALDKVLIPETLKTHQQRLLQAGFRSVDCWFQCFNFASIIAFK